MSDELFRGIPGPANARGDRDARADIKRWLSNWERAGRVLERERSDALVAMSDDDARQAALRLFELWRPEWPTDEGEALLLQQRVFARVARRSRS